MRQSRRVGGVLDSAASLTMIATGCVVMWVLLSPRLARTVETEPAPSIGLEVDVKILPAGTRLGDPAADVVIMEFSDFECPFCGRHARDTFPKIRRDFIDTKRTSYAFLHLPLESIHANAFRAAEAAECAADQDQFWPMHDAMFAAQDRLAESDLLQIASTLRLDGLAFKECLNGAKVDVVRRSMSEATRLGLGSTPSFLIGRRLPNGNVKVVQAITGAAAFEQFEAALSVALEAE